MFKGETQSGAKNGPRGGRESERGDKRVEGLKGASGEMLRNHNVTLEVCDLKNVKGCLMERQPYSEPCDEGRQIKQSFLV